MDRQDYVIEVSHVSKSFKDNRVLKDVSLLCESGRISLYFAKQKE